MEILEKKRKPKKWLMGIVIGVATVLILAGIFAIPYGIHYFYEDIAEVSDYEEDAGDVLIYWGNIIGGVIAIIGPVVLGLVTLRQNSRLMDQNERLVRLEAYNASPVIKTNLFGLYEVKEALPEIGTINLDNVKTLFSINKDLTFSEIAQNQSFVLLDDRTKKRDLMIIEIQNLSNYPITKIKAYMDVEDTQGEENERVSVRLMNFAPDEKQFWSITVPEGDLDYLNTYVKIIEFEFYTYKEISTKMTLFYIAGSSKYGRAHNVELLLNDSYSDSDMEGIID